MLRKVALLNGLLPIVAIHVTYLVAAMQGHVPWCVPYIDSCTSISATGRDGFAFYLFKGTMVPAAFVLMSYWYLCGQWLTVKGDSTTWVRVITAVGITGAIFLIIYVVALGAAGDMFRLQRRIGIIVYFTFTYLSQLLLVWRIGKVLPGDNSRRWLLTLSVGTLAVGLSTLLLDASINNYEDYEDAFEWTLALLIQLFFLMTWRTFAESSIDKG